MTKNNNTESACPHCRRPVPVVCGEFVAHAVIPPGGSLAKLCPGSEMEAP